MAKKKKKSRGGLSPNKYLSKEQVDVLKRYLNNRVEERGSLRDIVNKAIIDVLLNSGLRAAELCHLRIKDLPCYHVKLVIDVREGKGCVQRSVEISSALANRIGQFTKRYRRGARPSSTLFVNEHYRPLSYMSLYVRIRNVGRAAGIGYLKPHMLRHTYATMFYKTSKDLLMLQDQLGHADPRTTAIYARTLTEVRRQFAEAFDL